MLVDQEVRATTSEGRLRAEDAEARDQDGDSLIQEAPAADAAPEEEEETLTCRKGCGRVFSHPPARVSHEKNCGVKLDSSRAAAAAPAAAGAWCEDDELVLAKLERGPQKHGLSLDRLRACATRHGVTISSKTKIAPLKRALEAAKPDSSSSDDEDGIVVGARVMTRTHGAGSVLEGLTTNGLIRVRLDVPRQRGGFFESEVALGRGKLTRLAPGDAGYEAPSTTGAAGSGAAGSGAAAADALKVAGVLASPEQHALGFAAHAPVPWARPLASSQRH